MLAAFEPNNPPELASQVETVATELETAGISNGTYTPPSAVNIAQANLTAKIEAAAAAGAPGSFVTLGNGCSMVSPKMKAISALFMAFALQSYYQAIPC